MANITLQDLVNANINGIALFNDSEDFMIEITEDETVIGGLNCCETISEFLTTIKDTGKIDTCLTICPPQPPIA
jgi:hypothetical protein